MKILFISPSYYPHIGGVEYVVKSVAERLAKMGHKVKVLAGEPRANNLIEEEVSGVNVIRWPTWSPRGAYHFPRKREELEKTLEEFSKDVDVVHIHSVHSIISMYSLRILKNHVGKIVVTPYYHGTGHTAIRRFLWIFWRKYVGSLLKGCVVHTVSKLEANLVKQGFGVEAIPIENGVEEWIRELSWESKGYVMYSGRIEKYKNIDILARIVGILNNRYGLDLELKIFGRGAYRKELEDQLKRLGIPYEIEDFKPFKVYIETLRHATLFGLLSEKESYPQSINEANAIGIPVVVAKPWGLNFEGRKRTLIVDINQPIDVLVEKVYEFLKKVHLEEKSFVPTWNIVALEYMKKLYGG